MRRSPVVWIVIFVFSGTTALAQTTRPETPAKEGAAADQASPKEFLAGPTVDQAAARETDLRFGGPGRARNQVTVPVRQWFALLKKLELNDEQAVEVQRIVQTFQNASRDYQQSYGERSRKLQTQAREARRARRDVPSGVRRELAKLRSLAPEPTEYQKQIWALLAESQQASMRDELSEIRERILQRRNAQQRSDAMLPPSMGDRAQRRIAFLRARQSRKDNSGEAKDER